MQRIVPRVEQQRADEVAHARWLEDELARLEAPLDVVRALHRLELGDVAGWQLLYEIAARAGDEPARQAFGARRDQERGHVRFVERVLVELMVNETPGYPVTLPIAP